MSDPDTAMLLGTVDLPEGVLVILDPGLARFWKHDGPPVSPRRADPVQYDLEVVGRDAAAAGRAYDRNFDPLHLFDVTDVQKATEHFATFAAERHLDARLVPLAERMPHTIRVGHALEAGRGLGVVTYNGLWAVVAGGLPTSGIPLYGAPMPAGDFADRWKSLELRIDADAPAARTETCSGVMVDHGQLLFAGLGPLGQFRMWKSLDGLADFAFWGRDADALAQAHGAGEFQDGKHGLVRGWRDLTLELAGTKADAIQDAVQTGKLRVTVDYRPHCNLERLNAQLRSRDDRVGELVLGGARTIGCDNRWGDGVFSVTRELDANERVVRLRVDLGTEQRQTLMRRMMMRGRMAIVSRKVLDGGELIRFAERMTPSGSGDSGWFFSAGTESAAYAKNAKNFVLVSLSKVLESAPEAEPMLEAPIGARFKRAGKSFVVDED